jgi:hypothetical protein
MFLFRGTLYINARFSDVSVQLLVLSIATFTRSFLSSLDFQLQASVVSLFFTIFSLFFISFKYIIFLFQDQNGCP